MRKPQSLTLKDAMEALVGRREEDMDPATHYVARRLALADVQLEHSIRVLQSMSHYHTSAQAHHAAQQTYHAAEKDHLQNKLGELLDKRCSLSEFFRLDQEIDIAVDVYGLNDQQRRAVYHLASHVPWTKGLDAEEIACLPLPVRRDLMTMFHQIAAEQAAEVACGHAETDNVVVNDDQARSREPNGTKQLKGPGRS